MTLDPVTDPADRQMPGQGDWMLTYTGRQFWPFAPKASDIDLLDIAHALSNLCRYCGHTREFYSVAQHSVLVSQVAVEALGPPSVLDTQVRARSWLAAAWGLLHDAAEAYISDVIRPLKKSMFFKVPMATCAINAHLSVNAVEERIERAVAERFGLDWEHVLAAAAAVKLADNRLLMTERRDLMSDKGPGWHKWAEPLEERIVECWTPSQANSAFLHRADELGIE